MSFKQDRAPFAVWKGPFSPSRGRYRDYRVRHGCLIGFVSSPYGVTEVTAELSGAQSLASLVLSHWRGGRLLILPWGQVIKPYYDGSETQRVKIGSWGGETGPFTHLWKSKRLRPGSPWPGVVAGLACKVTGDGSVYNEFTVSDDLGGMQYTKLVLPPAAGVLEAFRAARPRDSSGRIQLLEDGAIIAPKDEGFVFVGTYRKEHLARI